MLTPSDIKSINGLSEQDATARLEQDGFNELPSSKKRSIFAIAFDVVREPMFLLLVACGTIYLILGDLQEALMLLGFVFVVVGITLYQERKTERALEALRDLSSPRALVIREGKQKRIPGREVVRGDVIALAEGDRVPADASVLACINLSVDESLLTGESVSVRKTACAEIDETPLQKETGKIVRNLAGIGLFLCALVVIVYGLTRGNWLNGFLAGITLAMALLPEEFPVVLTVFLALGAWRISQKRVLTRRVPEK